MKKIFCVSILMLLCINKPNFATTYSASVIKDSYSMVVFKLQKYFPETKLSRILRGEQVNEIIKRKREKGPKNFIKPNCVEVVIIDVLNSKMKTFNPVEKTRIPLSAKIEIYTYDTPILAKENYEYLLKSKNRWIEVGHGDAVYFTGKYSFRVTTLGSDELIKDLVKMTSDALITFIKIQRLVEK